MKIGNLTIAPVLYDFISTEVLPDLNIDNSYFWQGFEAIIDEFSPINTQLLSHRAKLQTAIDEWHKAQSAKPMIQTDYKVFLEKIGYIAPQVPDFKISTSHVDDEIANLAGPQLVVPINNARFALNAINARWGSLYDALYGTDAIAPLNNKSSTYDLERGQLVIEYGRKFLDSFLPLTQGSHSQAIRYQIFEQELHITLQDGQLAQLKDASQCLGYQGDKTKPSVLVFKHHGLHFEIQFFDTNVAKQDSAGISDIILESALTTIMDCEDSVAAVDAEDKTLVYRNWLGLNKGDLTEKLTKNGQEITRKISSDRKYTSLTEQHFSLKGRCVMFIRNVGHLMTNGAIKSDSHGDIYEGILDAVITSLIALYDIKQRGAFRNSEQGSIYIVKPKMHGPDEVKFTCQLFSAIEVCLDLPINTIKIGIMDEERRTSVNLKACIFEAKERVVFINTGFLDRTGDEIHTSMQAGVFIKKADIKHCEWIDVYEKQNVQIGLQCGLAGKAQIGKGMWAMPDQMAGMLEAKINHPLSGATTAWVPSPTAATLHAIHYHQVSVMDVQKTLINQTKVDSDKLLNIPVVQEVNWSVEEINAELENNAQGILGYVSRWIEQGIGCSKVPDINQVGLMEDRATLRISSQHIANWLLHGVCTKQQVLKVLERMAEVVDKQNASDSNYRAMAPNFSQSAAFNAACDLIFLGDKQPSGYTEPLLHKLRIDFKAAAK